MLAFAGRKHGSYLLFSDMISLDFNEIVTSLQLQYEVQLTSVFATSLAMKKKFF